MQPRNESHPLADERSDPTVTVSTSTSGSGRVRALVKTVTGHELQLLHERERTYYETARDKYLSEFAFPMANDMRALDRLLLLETQMFRWQWQQAAGIDYDGVDLDAGDEASLRKAIKETAQQISEVQKDLGLTRAQRDNDAESVAGYLQQLRVRAREHGIRREKQLGRALELLNELFGIAGAYSRANENERRKLGFEKADDIVDWINEVAQPRYDEIDQYFRKHSQRFWVRDMGSGS